MQDARQLRPAPKAARAQSVRDRGCGYRYITTSRSHVSGLPRRRLGRRWETSAGRGTMIEIKALPSSDCTRVEVVRSKKDDKANPRRRPQGEGDGAPQL